LETVTALEDLSAAVFPNLKSIPSVNIKYEDIQVNHNSWLKLEPIFQDSYWKLFGGHTAEFNVFTKLNCKFKMALPLPLHAAESRRKQY